MKRQLVIGGLVGIALGGLITASFAHGILQWQAGGADVSAPVTPPRDAGDEIEAPRSQRGFVPHRPLRPGSDRLGDARRKARQLAAAAPAPTATEV